MTIFCGRKKYRMGCQFVHNGFEVLNMLSNSFMFPQIPGKPIWRQLETYINFSDHCCARTWKQDQITFLVIIVVQISRPLWKRPSNIKSVFLVGWTCTLYHLNISKHRDAIDKSTNEAQDPYWGWFLLICFLWLFFTLFSCISKLTNTLLVALKKDSIE